MDETLRPRVAAARLLRWLATQGDTTSGEATPIDRLAQALGLQIAQFHPESRREGTLGWLEPGEDLIFLRQNLSEPVRRFTLAHEIGHAVLHRTSGAALIAALMPPSRDLLMPDTTSGCEDSDLDTPLTALAAGEEILRPGEAYSARARRESEANAFAAALLLPPDRLLARYLERAQQQTAFAGRRRGAITRSLAREFGVSEDVVLRSLGALLQSPKLPDELLASEQDEQQDTAPRRATLDASQRQASSAQSPALVVAGPGTGKTSTLVGRVTYLVEEQGIPADAILALTFSNKAAREMRERLETLLYPTATDSGPLMPPAMPTVSTIHAFCGDLVRRYAPLVGLRPDFRLISEAEGYFLLRQVAADLTLHHYQPLATPGLHFPALLAAISRAKDELAGPERYATVAQEMMARATTSDERYAAERACEVAAVYLAYQNLLAARGDADFGDLIRLAVQLLREQPEVLAEVRARYRHVLVDEFQDINRAMGVLLRLLASETTALWAVGDADQAIYRFRGASPANLARFTSDYPQAQVHTLRRNYRSVPDILTAAAGVANAALGERTPLTANRRGAGAAITLAIAPDEQAELAGLAREIRRRAELGRPFGEQVVLCRTRRQCQRVAAALAAADIPTRLAAPLLEQDDTKDLLGVLSLLGDLSGSGLLRAGNIPDHAFSQQEARAVLAAARVAHQAPLVTLLQRLDSVEELTPAGRRGLTTLAQIIRELRQAPDVLTGVSRYIFSYTRIGHRLMRQITQHGPESSADVQAERLMQVLGLARAFEDQRRSQSAASSSSSDARTHADWAAFLEYVRVMLVLRQETGSAEEGPGETTESVRVLTVHASKGLEFPVVYLPGLADRRFPMQRRGNIAPLLPGLDEEETLEAHDPDAHLAEEACLFYVALTRARDELVLSRAERYGRMRYKPSPFLEPIETALGRRLTHARWLPVRVEPADGIQSQSQSQSAHEQEEGDASDVVPAQEAHEPLLPVAPADGPVRHAAIETYQRCPRQYAYRYVYGLRPREIGLATLRRTLHDTLHTLQQRFARPGRYVAGGGPEKVSLQDALSLFENEWTEKLDQERRLQGNEDEGNTADATDATAVAELEAPSAVPGDAFLEVYRRHGRHVIERAWAGMVQQQLPGIDAEGLIFDAEETSFDEQVTLRVGERELSVLLDRVERGEAAATPPPANGHAGPTGATSTTSTANSAIKPNGKRQATAVPSTPASQPAPVRIVRHRLGRSSAGKPDLHALFYALAAQQSGAATAEFYSHNLTTGELERVTLDERKLAKLREELDTLLDGIESGFYPPKPDPATCQNCPFLLICPA